MIKKEDIKKAIKTFKEWDNNKLWDSPSEVFKHHTLEKSENALKTAEYILKIMEDQSIKDLFNADDYDGTLWIINASYYRFPKSNKYVTGTTKTNSSRKLFLY